MKKVQSLWWDGFLFFGVILIDRITKWYAIQRLTVSYHVNQFLSFELVYNRGISWGLLHSHNDTVFMIVSLMIGAVTIAVAISAWTRLKHGHAILGEVMVVAGSCANLIDRVLYGGVVDFILLSYGQWSWPVFNIADAAIVLGIGIMLWEYYRS